MRDESRAAQRAAAEAARARARLERESTRATERAERERTRATKDEASKRLKAERDEARDRKREIDKTTRDAEKAEKERTRNAEREANKRAKAEERATRQQLALATRRSRELGGRVATGVGTAARAVYGGAVAMHGQFQDARERRAAGERTLGNAVRNANPNASSQEQAAARDRVRRFVTETGMNFGDVADALMEGQAHGSSLQAEGNETTAQALERSLATIREANAEGASPGQYLAARGRLAASGLTGDALKTAMRFSLGAAQAGQVEVDQIIGAGLPGASRLMEARVAALGPGASAEAQQQARLNAWRESVSTQEVLAASGGAAGHTSNTLASLQNFLNTPRRQEMALTNIKAAESQINTSTPEGRARAAQLRALYEGDNAIFERDPTRTGNAMRLRGGVAAAEFATRVATATGGNAQMAANIFAGGGHGNAQALLSNMRSLMAVLGGERGQRVQTMMQGMGVTDAQISAHQRDVESDTLSNLTRAQEERDNALTDNTSWLKNLSDAIHDWQVRNPIANQALDSSRDVLTSLGGGVALHYVKNLVAKQALPAIVEGAGGGTAATVATASVLPVVGAVAATVGSIIQSGRTAVTGKDLAGNEVGGLRQAGAAAGILLTPLAIAEVSRQLGDAIVGALRSQPLSADVPLHADIHARASGAR
jgi:hypothetical protein